MSHSARRLFTAGAWVFAITACQPAIAAGQAPPPEPPPFPVSWAPQEKAPTPEPENQKPDANGQEKSPKNGNGKKNGDDQDEAKDKDAKNGDDKEKDDKKKAEEPKWYSAHAQGTVVSQGNWKFHSPYEGPNSLLPILNYRTTHTGTLFLAARVWDGAELVFNPEISGGRGLSETLGMAGFPNGEATRVGAVAPTPYVARLFLRQTVGFGGETEKVADAPNQVAGVRDVDRITVTLGKFAATDFFDNNAYSHDPRTQFLNWSLMNNGAWDYPANVRGYTYGGVLELNTKDRALRYGVWGEPKEANGQDIEPRFLRANGHALEWEERYKIDDRPGKLRLLGYLNNAHMGNYRVTLRHDDVPPDITNSRAFRVKYGFGLNLEQELAEDLGAFLRLGWNDGHTESWAFTEIDATAAVGVQLKGKSWQRADDTVGLALVVNGLSNGHRDYLAAGGLGFIIGDGALSYAPETILESYYDWQIKEGIQVTFDFQGVANPAYNRDRGPVAIAAVRVHVEF
jgi:high affinity Mn2+ porin